MGETTNIPANNIFQVSEKKIDKYAQMNKLMIINFD
jgi:hypothetical protein